MDSTQDYFFVIAKLLGSLGLLIFGMKMLSESLQKQTGPQLRHVLAKMTSNRVAGLLTGTMVTAAVQSSSATTVMTVSFVNAGLLTLAQGISVIMGANIGTTLTAWIMSLGYNVDLSVVVFPAFFVGMLMVYSKRQRNVGDLLFGLAFMLLSLVILSETGKEMDLAHNAVVVNFFASFDTESYLTVIIFLAAGTLITCIVQSSAAVMAITILLCSTGVLPIYLGVALVLGENIGTTATANIAALGANTQARRAALAHMLFNVIGVIWVLIVFYPFTNFVLRIIGYDPSVGNQAALLPVALALFHTCFNVTNTFLLIFFIPQLERLVCTLLPIKEETPVENMQLQYIQGNLVQTPEISVLQAQLETAHFAQRMQTMFGEVCNLFDTDEREAFLAVYTELERQESAADKTEVCIARYLEQLGTDHLSDTTKRKVTQIMREISELESIGDACFNIARILQRYRSQNQKNTRNLFTEWQQKRLRAMMQLTEAALEQMYRVIKGNLNRRNVSLCYRIEEDINTMRATLKSENIQAVNERRHDYASGIVFMDIVNECEKLGDYVINVVQARIGH